jgi:hypothetical protein
MEALRKEGFKELRKEGRKDHRIKGTGDKERVILESNNLQSLLKNKDIS